MDILNAARSAADLGLRWEWEIANEEKDPIMLLQKIVLDKDSLIVNTVESENVITLAKLETLQTLYYTLSLQNDRNIFVNTLMSYIMENDFEALQTGWYDSRVLPFFCLLSLGRLKEINMILKDAVKRKKNVFYLFIALHDFFRYKQGYLINKGELDVLCETIENKKIDQNYKELFNEGLPGGLQALKRIRGVIRETIYNRVEERILEQNAEINHDRETLILAFEEIGFSKDLSEALMKIEEYYKESKDSFDWSSGISFIRNFLEDLQKKILEKVEQLTEKRNDQGKWSFVAEKLQMGESGGQFLNGFWRFVNSQGAHRLRSEREYYRLVKNMNIEVSLLLMKKLQMLSEESG